MLQSIREGVGRWVAIAIMALIAVTFIFWGVDFSLTGTTFAAKVNGTDIPLLEFDRELQNQQAQYQDLYRVELTDDLQSELRQAVLERLIMYEALLQHVNDSGYRVSDERVIAAIQQRPEFQIGGEFSLDVFRATLLNAGLTEQGFIERERERLAQLELQAGIMTSGFYTAEEYTRYVELYNQRREIAYAIFAADDFVDATIVDEAAIVAHYEANKAAYYSDESVDVEYIEIQGADIAETVEVTEEELEQYYEDEQYRFQTEEERQARHILLSLDTEDPETAVADILARLDAGEEFSDLAAELSEDAGTSGLGGDLGWVARGLLVGPFEDTLFEMEVGAVEGPVETDFGYHIIRLEDIRAGEVQTFEQVRDELAQDFQSSRASEQFYDLASELADRSFDAFNELASVATELGLPLQTLNGLTRSGDSTPFSDATAIVQAAFDPVVLAQQENSSPIELADDHIVVLRVRDHHLPAEQPLELVRDVIEEELSRAAAQELAETAAAEFFAAIDTNDDVSLLAEELSGAWFPEAWVERADADVPTQVLAAAFRWAHPAEGGVLREIVPLASGDYAVLALSGVEPGSVDATPREERNAQNAQLAEQASLAELSGYAREVRDDATVRIPDIVLNPIY